MAVRRPLSHYLGLLESGELLKTLECPVLVWNNPESAVRENTGELTVPGMAALAASRRAGNAVAFELGSAADGAASLILGRSSGCQIHLPEETVSRRHVELQVTRHGWTATDLGSKNGTWVGGSQIPPLAPVGVNDGARLQVGGVELFFMSPESFHAYLAQLKEPAQRAQ